MNASLIISLVGEREDTKVKLTRSNINVTGSTVLTAILRVFPAHKTILWISCNLNDDIFSLKFIIMKIARLGRQDPQLAGTTKWPTTLRFRKS